MIRRLDLHVHSKISHDGVLEPKDIVRIGKECGLDGVAVTDHNTIRGGLETARYATDDFEVIVGSEIMTEKGEIIGLFLKEEIWARTFLDVLAEIKLQGGVIVIPHPFDKIRHNSFHITGEYADRIDAIEGFNSRCIFKSYNVEAMRFATEHGLPVVGGSDAHYASEIGLGGIAVATDDVRAEILRGETTIFGERSPIYNHAKTKIRKIMMGRR